MSEKHNEYRVKNISNSEEDNVNSDTQKAKKYSIDMGPLMNPIDISSIMNNENHTLETENKNEQTIQIPLLNLLKSHDTKVNPELVSMSEQIKKIVKDIAKIQEELAQLKEQNERFVEKVRSEFKYLKRKY